MKIIYDLEEFCITEIFNPYKSDFDERLLDESIIWAFLGNTKSAFDIKLEYGKLLMKYTDKIKNDLMWYPTEVDKRPELKKQIFNRLKQIKFKFYHWLQSPFIDWVNNGLREVE